MVQNVAFKIFILPSAFKLKCIFKIYMYHFRRDLLLVTAPRWQQDQRAVLNIFFYFKTSVDMAVFQTVAHIKFENIR